MELIGPDIALGLKGERIKEDSGFLRSIYQGREPQRGNRCGRRDESFQVESSVHYEIRSRIGGVGLGVLGRHDSRQPRERCPAVSSWSEKRPRPGPLCVRSPRPALSCQR